MLLFIALFCAGKKMDAQIKPNSTGWMERTHDWRMRWNVVPFLTVGRSTLQFGFERDFKNRKTFGFEIGGCNTNNRYYFTERYAFKGIQVLGEYRSYLKGFHDRRVQPFLNLGLFARRLDFNAEVTLGYNITDYYNWTMATHYEKVTARYKTYTFRAQFGIGFRVPVTGGFYMEAQAGPALAVHSIQNDIERPKPYVTEGFYNSAFLSSEPGTYGTPAFQGSVGLGFVLFRTAPGN